VFLTRGLGRWVRDCWPRLQPVVAPLLVLVGPHADPRAQLPGDPRARARSRGLVGRFRLPDHLASDRRLRCGRPPTAGLRLTALGRQLPAPDSRPIPRPPAQARPLARSQVPRRQSGPPTPSFVYCMASFVEIARAIHIYIYIYTYIYIYMKIDLLDI